MNDVQETIHVNYHLRGESIFGREERPKVELQLVDGTKLDIDDTVTVWQVIVQIIHQYGMETAIAGVIVLALLLLLVAASSTM